MLFRKDSKGGFFLQICYVGNLHKSNQIKAKTIFLKSMDSCCKFKLGVKTLWFECWKNWLKPEKSGMLKSSAKLVTFSEKKPGIPSVPVRYVFMATYLIQLERFRKLLWLSDVAPD